MRSIRARRPLAFVGRRRRARGARPSAASDDRSRTARPSRVDARVAARRAPVRPMAATDRRAPARFRRIAAQQLPAGPAHVHERPDRPERLGLDRAAHRDPAAPREVASRQGAAQGDDLPNDSPERNAGQWLRHARGGDRLRTTGRQDHDGERDAHDSAGQWAVPGDDRRRGVVARSAAATSPAAIRAPSMRPARSPSSIPSTTLPRWGRSPSRSRPSSITC